MAKRKYFVLFGAFTVLLVMGLAVGVFYVWKNKKPLNLLGYIPGSATRVVYFNPHTVWDPSAVPNIRIIKELAPDFFLEQTAPLESFVRAHAKEVAFFYTPISPQSPGVIIKTKIPEELFPPQGFAFQFEFGNSAIYKRTRAHINVDNSVKNEPSEYYAYLQKQELIIKSFHLKELLEMISKPVHEDSAYPKLLKSEIFRYGVKNLGSFESIVSAPYDLSMQDNTLHYIRVFMYSPEAMQFYRGNDSHFSPQSIDRIALEGLPKNLALWVYSPDALPLLYTLLAQKDQMLEQFNAKQAGELFRSLGVLQELYVFKNDEQPLLYNYVLRFVATENSLEALEHKVSTFLGNKFMVEYGATLTGGLEVVELRGAEEAFLWHEEQTSQGVIRFVQVHGVEFAYLQQWPVLWLSDSLALLKTAMGARHEFLGTLQSKVEPKSSLYLSTQYTREFPPIFEGLTNPQQIFMWVNQQGEIFGTISN